MKKKAKSTSQWKPVADMAVHIQSRIELPRPLPLEFTAREMSYLLLCVSSDALRGKEDKIGVAMLSKLYNKLFVVWREYLLDLEKLEVTNAPADIPEVAP